MTTPIVETEPATEPTPQLPSQISIRVIGQDGGEVFFKVRSNVRVGKIFAAYCNRKAVAQSSVRFLFDGQRLDESKTLEELGIENDDVIDALLQQTGGL